MKAKIAILFISMLLLCLPPVFAEEAVLVQNGYEYDVQVSGAEAGKRYLLVCIKDETQSVDAADIISSDLLYMRQVEAAEDTFSFGGVVPRELTTAGVFVIDHSGNQLYAGSMKGALSGDVDGDGAVDEADRALLLNYLAACVDLSPNAVSAADTDQSGTIDVFDLKIIDGMLSD